METRFKVKGLFILENRELVSCEDMLEHVAWMGQNWRDCIVAVTQLADCEVHTCFLGMDLRSVLSPAVKPNPFETMVFGGTDRSGGVLDLERTSSWEEASKMHEHFVRKFSKDQE